MLAFNAVLWLGAASPILVAAIGGGLAYFIKRLDRRNTNQHDVNLEVLNRIHSTVVEVAAKVEAVDEKVSDHIAWHAHAHLAPHIRTNVQKEDSKR